MIIDVNGVKIGGKEKIIMAGPCTIESRQTTRGIAEAVKNAGADILRGGAYKPRSNPNSFQGLGLPGLMYMAEAREKTGMPIITEATGPHNHIIRMEADGAELVKTAGEENYFTLNGEVRERNNVLDNVVSYTDIVQIGARNMKAYGFLQLIAEKTKETGLPVLIKRGEEANIDEFLGAAAYVERHGNPEKIILCLRGIRTFDNGYMRYTPDIGSIPVIKENSDMPVIFDPSHSTGKREYVEAVSLAAIAAGADGLLIECHTHPENTRCDGRQSVKPDTLERIAQQIK